MKSAGKARSNGLYRHIRTSKEIIRNLLNDSINNHILFITLCNSIAGIHAFGKCNSRMLGSLNHPKQLRFR